MSAERPDRYEIRLTKPARHALYRLDPKVADAVIRFLEGPLADDPWRVTKPLHGELARYRSGYVGIAYRVMVQIDDATVVVYVVAVDHRADTYRAR